MPPRFTGFDISNASGVTSTVLLTFGNLAGQRIAMYAIESSTTIFPRFNGLDSLVMDRTLNAVAKTVPIQLTAYGFEVEV